MRNAIDCVHLDELKGLTRLLEYTQERKRRLSSRVFNYNTHHLPSITPPPIPLLSWKRKSLHDNDDNQDGVLVAAPKDVKKLKLTEHLTPRISEIQNENDSKLDDEHDAESEKEKPMEKHGWWSKYKPSDIVALDTEMVTLSEKHPNQSKYSQSAASVAVVSMEKMQTLYYVSLINYIQY